MVKLRLYGHCARLDGKTGISIAMESASENDFSHDHQHASVSGGMRETSHDPCGENSRGKVPNFVANSKEAGRDASVEKSCSNIQNAGRNSSERNLAVSAETRAEHRQPISWHDSSTFACWPVTR